mmetsp:Transcript_32955/g.104943  ORF Transcript_32955/g.104943 Transcript_32955/m.104943 type:complete len:227 (+) Transcript_32955:4194-4874(+)
MLLMRRRGPLRGRLVVSGGRHRTQKSLRLGALEVLCLNYSPRLLASPGGMGPLPEKGSLPRRPSGVFYAPPPASEVMYSEGGRPLARNHLPLTANFRSSISIGISLHRFQIDGDHFDVSVKLAAITVAAPIRHPLPLGAWETGRACPRQSFSYLFATQRPPSYPRTAGRLRAEQPSRRKAIDISPLLLDTGARHDQIGLRVVYSVRCVAGGAAQGAVRSLGTRHRC